MSETVSLSFRVNPKISDQLERLANSTDRPKSWLLEQALLVYLETHAWQVAHIKKGLKEFKQGKGVEHKKVKEWLDSWGSKTEKEPPK